MLSFSLVAEALTGLIYHRPSGENSKFAKQSLSEFKSCEHTHFDHLLSSAALLHFMTIEYITSNKGGRKLAFENNISMKQKVLSNGTVWGDIWGDFVQGDFVRGDFVLGGILSRGILSGGFCPGGFVRGDFVLEPLNIQLLVNCTLMVLVFLVCNYVIKNLNF